MRVDGNGAYLKDASGTPFYLQGEAAWSAITQLTLQEAREYAADRRARGFNALFVGLIEHQFADDAPRNTLGDAPFPSGHPFEPQSAYFDYAAEVLEIFRESGMLVFLAPAYLGYEGGDEGWYAEMESLDEQTCLRYGTFVGERFRELPNIVWVAGGDYSPPPGSAGERCLAVIMDGITAAEPGALMTAHWARGTDSLSQAAFRGMVDLNGVYASASDTVSDDCLAGRATATVPTFLIEAIFENEHDVTPQELREGFYGSVDGCRAGYINGNRPIWLFDEGWEQALGSIGSQQLQVGGSIVRSLRWWEFVEDSSLLEGAVALRTADRSQALIYGLGDAGSIRLKLDGSWGSLTATALDPITGAAVASMDADAGAAAVELATPQANAGGDHDWVVVLRTK